MSRSVLGPATSDGARPLQGHFGGPAGPPRGRCLPYCPCPILSYVALGIQRIVWGASVSGGFKQG